MILKRGKAAGIRDTWEDTAIVGSLLSPDSMLRAVSSCPGHGQALSAFGRWVVKAELALAGNY